MDGDLAEAVRRAGREAGRAMKSRRQLIKTIGRAAMLPFGSVDTNMASSDRYFQPEAIRDSVAVVLPVPEAPSNRYPESSYAQPAA